MSFVKTLQHLGGGKVLGDCENGLAEVVAAVKNTRGKGKLELTMRVEFDEDEGGVVLVDVEGEVKVKAPKPRRQGLRAYVRDDGQLSTRDPRQAQVAENVVALDQKTLAAGG